MLTIPTSLDTAIFVEIGQPLVWSAILWSALICGVYLLWEMLIAAFSGRKPRASRTLWLIAAALLIGSSILGSELISGPVTFNADSTEWMATTWGGVLSAWGMVMFVPCALVLLVLRTKDSLAVGPVWRVPYVVWWVLGLTVAIAYGSLLALNEQLVGGAAMNTVLMSGGFVLTIVCISSLIAVPAIRTLRARYTVLRRAVRQ